MPRSEDECVFDPLNCEELIRRNGVLVVENKLLLQAITQMATLVHLKRKGGPNDYGPNDERKLRRMVEKWRIKK